MIVSEEELFPDYAKTEEEAVDEKTTENEPDKAAESEVDTDTTADAAQTDNDTKYFYYEPDTMPENVEMIIYKGERCLELIGDGELIGKFRIGLGGNAEGDKLKEGDQRTPEGSYYIAVRNPNSSYTLSMGLSYPNIEDAERGLEEGIIDEAEFKRIKKAIDSGRRPPWDTAMGGEIFIHGSGSSSDWTLGCIALDDEDIRILWEWGAIGIPVEILP